MLKRIFLISLIIAALVLSACGRDEVEEPVEDVIAQSAGWRSTVVYYADENGLVIPIMKRIPWEEGIGRAALDQLVATPANAASAARMGLECPIPDGALFELRISDLGVATVNIIGLAPMSSALEEQRLVTAVVNTLTEFDSIDAVTLRFDGEKLSAMPNGMTVQDEMSALPLNLETTELPASTGEVTLMTVYYPNAYGSLNIPVSSYVANSPTFRDAVNRMAAGSPLAPSVFPAGVTVLSAVIENGAAMVDFSAEFRAAENTDGLALAIYDALYLNALEFGAVDSLTILVSGTPYYVDGAAISPPRFANELRG